MDILLEQKMFQKHISGIEKVHQDVTKDSDIWEKFPIKDTKLIMGEFQIFIFLKL